MQSELEKNISKELDYGEYFCLCTVENIIQVNNSFMTLMFCWNICNTGFLPSGTSELEGASTRMSPVGSACGSQKNLNSNLIVDHQDPLSRATQQYLEVLKKNYMIWNTRSQWDQVLSTINMTEKWFVILFFLKSELGVERKPLHLYGYNILAL